MASHLNNLLVIFEECKIGRHDECQYIIGDEKCGCEHHLNVIDTSPDMAEGLRRQRAEQDEIDTITPNPPHIP